MGFMADEEHDSKCEIGNHCKSCFRLLIKLLNAFWTGPLGYACYCGRPADKTRLLHCKLCLLPCFLFALNGKAWDKEKGGEEMEETRKKNKKCPWARWNNGEAVYYSKCLDRVCEFG